MYVFILSISVARQIENICQRRCTVEAVVLIIDVASST